uniref:60S ribosomal protein L18a-like protein n=1 Tax=Rhizophora mucronata TaxID=61149 RepID=A0A2P2IM72_RHIMU
MAEEGESKGVTAGNTQDRYYYGTFQGVANYYPPAPQPPPQPVVGFPQPVAPNHGFLAPPYQYYAHGYQSIATGYAVCEGRPPRERRIPFCGMGMGWFLFIIGFILGGIPWYIGTFILLCIRVDYREKPGYVACAIATVLALIALTLGATKGSYRW